MEFTELTMHPDLARGVAEAGYTTCMPVQAAVFPHAFSGEDIYAQSQTGTGKTAAFLVSIFQRIMTDPACRHRKTLILAPTRELAVQIDAEAKKLGKYVPVSTGCFYGGVAYGPQFDMLRDNVQMIIGTPGRIIDLVQQGKMLLRDVGFLVVDEADRMFDMGFIDDLRKLLRYLPKPSERQTYLFSATLNFRVKNLAWEYMDEPKEIVIEAETVTVELVTQELYHVGSDEKFKVLLGILAKEKPKSALIFCNQKFMAEEVARRLGINGIECEYIMGDLPQSKRLQVIEKLKAGQLEILVATDVAARGLDVNALDLVVNYDVPMDPESYVHRIGRTARAGAAGKAISLACEKFVYGLPAIEKYIEAKIPVMAVTEELFGDDKSSGMRFGHARDRGRPTGDRTGYRGRPGHGAGDRGDRHDRADRRGRDKFDRGERRGEPRSDTRGDFRGERPAPAGREGQRAPEARSARGQGPQTAQGRKPARPAETQGQHGPRPRGESRDPYAMSAEERMSRYREKYSGAAPGDEATMGGTAGSPGSRNGGARGSDRNDRGNSAQGGRKERARSGHEAQGRTDRGSRRPDSGPSSGPGRPKPEAAGARKKPGLLDRIKRIFGFGGDGE